MILYPPIRFDLNEWFLITVSVLGWAAYFMLKNRFPLIVLFGIWLFNIYMGQTIDFAIAQGPPIDLYDYNDRPQYEWFDLFMYLFTYPPVSLIVVWGYVRFHPRGWRLAVCVIATALATAGLEAVAWMCNVYHYKGWNLFYSVLFYIVSTSMNIAFYRLIVRLLPRKTTASMEPRN
jgi:hypothetical protein